MLEDLKVGRRGKCLWRFRWRSGELRADLPIFQSPEMQINTYYMKPIHFVSADEAVKVVKSGDHIHFSSVSCFPQILADALCRRGENGELQNVRIHHLHTEGNAPTLRNVSTACSSPNRSSWVPMCAKMCKLAGPTIFPSSLVRLRHFIERRYSPATWL